VGISSDPAFAKQLNDLAREIVNDGIGAISIDRAHAIAEAEIDIARARLTKVALIEQVRAFGAVKHRPVFKTRAEIRRLLSAFRHGNLIEPEREDPVPTMSSQEPERTVEAIRRALPELIKLDRYERRATVRQERALNDIFNLKL